MDVPLWVVDCAVMVSAVVVGRSAGMGMASVIITSHCLEQLILEQETIRPWTVYAHFLTVMTGSYACVAAAVMPCTNTTEGVVLYMASQIISSRANGFLSSFVTVSMDRVWHHWIHQDGLAQAEQQMALRVKRREDEIEHKKQILEIVAPLLSGVSQQDEMMCSVCHENIDARLLHRRLPCSHQFHATCVDEWLLGYGEISCPTCREPVMDDPEE